MKKALKEDFLHWGKKWNFSLHSSLYKIFQFTPLILYKNDFIIFTLELCPRGDHENVHCK